MTGSRSGNGRAPGAAAPPELDVALVNGFRFRCQPACALCCYAEPVVTPAERDRLIAILPSVEFVDRGRSTFVGSAPDGGACRLLAGDRCRAHDARPSPCREYPVSVHLGSRAQATLVLSCPGVELSPLTGYRGPGAAGPSDGFDRELASVRARLTREAAQRLDGAERRRRRIVRALRADGRWEDDESVRATCRAALPLPGASDFPVESPPSLDDGAENLPLVHRAGPAPIAIADGLGGWELRELRPSGGADEPLAVVPPPGRPPSMTEEAGATLAGYLRYWLERDSMFAVVHLAMLEDGLGTVRERVAAELATIGATVLSRAHVLSVAAGAPTDRLDRSAVELGIRATDQDLLDRPSWGGWL